MVARGQGRGASEETKLGAYENTTFLFCILIKNGRNAFDTSNILNI